MAQRPKAKRKQKSQRNTDKKQSERFIEAARTLGADDASKFESTFKKIVPEKLSSK
jgi:hypothetical protein